MLTIPISTMIQIILIVLLSGLAWNASIVIIEYLKFKYIAGKLAETKDDIIESLTEAIKDMETSVDRVKKADQKIPHGQTCYAPSSVDISDKYEEPNYDPDTNAEDTEPERGCIPEAPTISRADTGPAATSLSNNPSSGLKDFHLNFGATQDSSGPKNNS